MTAEASVRRSSRDRRQATTFYDDAKQELEERRSLSPAKKGRCVSNRGAWRQVLDLVMYSEDCISLASSSFSCLGSHAPYVSLYSRCFLSYRIDEFLRKI